VAPNPAHAGATHHGDGTLGVELAALARLGEGDSEGLRLLEAVVVDDGDRKLGLSLVGLVRVRIRVSGGGGSLYLGLSLLSGVTACDTEEIGKIHAPRGAPQGAGCIAF
jgi:hypothetical protein